MKPSRALKFQAEKNTKKRERAANAMESRYVAFFSLKPTIATALVGQSTLIAPSHMDVIAGISLAAGSHSEGVVPVFL